MVLTEEQRREMIRNAGQPKKGHHWSIQRQDRNGDVYKAVEEKTQFKSHDGKLVAERVSREWYTVLDAETSYIIASVPGRTYAKGLVNELGPLWADTFGAVVSADVGAVNSVREIVRKYKAIAS